MRARRSGLWVVPIAVAAMVSGASRDAAAAAGEGRVDVRWSAPDECPSGADVSHAVDLLIGGAAAQGENVDTSAVSATVTKLASGFRVVVARDGATDRVIEAATCKELADATAIVVSLMTAPAPKLEAPTPPPNARPPSEEPTAPLPVPKIEPRPHVDEGRTKFAAALDARGDVGSLPNLAEGFALSAAWTPDPYRLEMTATYWPAQIARVGPSGTGGTFDLFAGTFRACDALFGGGLVSACAAIEVGSLRGSGLATATTSSERGLWLAPGVGLFGAIPIKRAFALRLAVDANVPIFREDFYLANVGSVHRPAAVVGRGSVGGEFRF